LKPSFREALAHPFFAGRSGREVKEAVIAIDRIIATEEAALGEDKT
jgi:hypothetical protein